MKKEIFLSVLVLSSCAAAFAAPVRTQSLLLQPGWNAIYLEVTPSDTAIGVVFNGINIDSVWTYGARISSVGFIQDPNEPVWNSASWRVYLPIDRAESLQNNLFHVEVNRPYLVKLNGNALVTLNVTGTPSLRRPAWAPDAYNLRGFPIDPNAPPTFQTFFRPSPAHFDAQANQLRKIYRLNASGQWTLVNPSDSMNVGEAYWVYTQGPSEYMGPLSVRLESGDGLEFGGSVENTALRLHNHTTSAINSEIADLRSPGPSALSYSRINPAVGFEWVDLPAAWVNQVNAGEDLLLRLAIRRQDFGAQTYESIVEIKDNAGTRFLLPVTATRSPAAGVGPLSGLRAGRQIAKQSVAKLTPADEAKTHAGLWVGTATLNSVSEAHSGTLQVNGVGSDGQPIAITRVGVSPTPTPVKFEFSMRLLLHVDNNGTTRLLKEVVQLWKDGTYKATLEGRQEVDEPGRHVLITDEARLGQFQGATLRDGVPVGRRLCSVGFDFSSPRTENFLALTGNFAVDNSVSGTILINPNFTTNPFKHKYHAAHDNLDATFKDFKAEAFEILRQIQLTFAAADPGGGAAAPDYGYSTIAGVYQETVTGLHREAITAKGIFRLRRMSEVGELNP